MSTDIESLGLLFELQWKKKPGGNNREDVASIGIWDTPNASLDWVTFKSYVCQNLGTLEDIYMAYIDSDGDEIPIESECEFQEALKFARQRASQGREVVLKVEKCVGPASTSQATSPAQKVLPVSKLMTDAERDMKKKHTKSKSVPKMKSGDKMRIGVTHSSNSVLPSTEEGKLKVEASGISNEIGKKLGMMMKPETEKRKRTKTEKEDSPPTWFKKYMQEFKNEIVAEITTSVMYNTRQVLDSVKMISHPSCRCGERNGGSVAVTRSRKKKSTDEDSDGALSGDQRDHKLLKKIEKLHKREKKLEKKLDSKLEKLENKTKRRMEKKIQSRSCSEQPSEKKTNTGSGKRTKDWPVGTYLMDAVSLNDGPKPAETHIRLGGRFTKAWEIMNSGTLPWTDKTELRLAWGSYGLEPKAAVVKCPLLKPGEKGVIAVTFRAPQFPGRFESYWHFYHMGVRFGHWLDCAVIVDGKETEKQEVTNETPVASSVSGSVCDKKPNEDQEIPNTKVDQPVDLRKKYEPNQESGSTDVKSLVGMDNVCDKLNEDKRTSVESEKTETRERNAEYESDSDDENLSVISGTISLTSDSEEDENFVLVPMPLCFMCDCPVQSSDPAPAAVNECLEQSENGNPEVQCDSEKNVQHTEISNEGEAPCSLNMGLENTGDGQKCDCEVEDTPVPEMSKETSTHDEPVSHDRSEHVMYSRSEVYAVDMAGHCMPVDSAWASHNNNHCNYTLFGNSKVYDHSSKSSCFTDSDTSSSQGRRDDIKHGRSSGKNTSFHATAHSHATAGPFNMSFSVGEMGNNGQAFGTSFTYKTTPSTNTTQNGFRQWENTTSSNTTQGPCPDQSQFATSFNYATSSSSSTTTTTTQSGFEEHEGQKSSSNTPEASSVNPPHFGSSFNTSSSRNGTHNGSEQCHSPTSSADTSQAGSPNQPEDLFGAAVHILPETLVNGAVSVASHAFTTARSVLNNLGFGHAEGHAEWNWNDNAGSWSVQPAMSTTECLEILLEMGFTNKNLNVLLLQRYDNDITKVVAELLT